VKIDRSGGFVDRSGASSIVLETSPIVLGDFDRSADKCEVERRTITVSRQNDRRQSPERSS
jgi:hypothetical protein